METNVWIPNLISSAMFGGLVIGVFAWFWNKHVKHNEDRMTATEKRVIEVELNYNSKFREVNNRIENAAEKQSRNLDNAVGRITERMDKMEHNTNEHRQQQSRQVAILETKMDSLIDAVRESRGHNKP